MLFAHAKTIFLESWRSTRRPQDEQKRLREVPNGHLKSFKTSKERVPKKHFPTILGKERIFKSIFYIIKCTFSLLEYKFFHRKKLKKVNVGRYRVSVSKSLNNLFAQIIDNKKNCSLLTPCHMYECLFRG